MKINCLVLFVLYSNAIVCSQPPAQNYSLPLTAHDLQNIRYEDALKTLQDQLFNKIAELEKDPEIGTTFSQLDMNKKILFAWPLTGRSIFLDMLLLPKLTKIIDK